MYKIVLDKNFAESFQKEESNILLSKWNLEENRPFQKGKTIFLIETEKALFEVSAGRDGYLKKILLQEGELLDASSILAVVTDKPSDNSPLPQNPVQLDAFPTNLIEEE